MSKIGRNDPCPCGSGKKFKQCCMKQSAAAARAQPQIDPLLVQAMKDHRAGNLALAEQGFRLVLRQSPRDADALHFLGVIAYQTGRFDEALKLISAAIGIRDTDPGYFCNLGLVNEALHRVDAAVRCYRMALSIDRNYAEANCNLGGILVNQMNLDEAIVLCRRALDARPDIPEAWCNLGLAYHYRGQLDPAVDCYHKALRINPDCVQAWHNLGNTLRGQNRQDEAIACLDRAIALKPDNAGAYGSLYFALLYRAGSTADDVLIAHRRFAQQFEKPLRRFWSRHSNRRDPERKLKIGYVSPDFRNHSVAFFMEPVIERHDRSGFEIHAYYNHAMSDETTSRIRGSCDHWVSCINMSDGELAERIRADGIDILIDLAGHSANNRLLVFARKPAPVQVAYLGYPATTGLTAIDWRLTTAEVDPDGSDGYYSERLWRLPRSLWCYRPADSLSADARPPARDGAVCFGSLNNYPKVSPDAIALWGRILRELPRSSLIMTHVPEGSARETLFARFAANGVDRERLILHHRLPASEFHDVARGIDIALDPFPYNGTTTTCEALWRGIPVVTLRGNTSVSRSGHALLNAVGLDACCAGDEDAYVRIAVELARDTARLQSLKSGLRARMASSPLRDESGFVHEIEEAYRGMWREWCARKEIDA